MAPAQFSYNRFAVALLQGKYVDGTTLWYVYVITRNDGTEYALFTFRIHTPSRDNAHILCAVD